MMSSKLKWAWLVTMFLPALVLAHQTEEHTGAIAIEEIASAEAVPEALLQDYLADASDFAVIDARSVEEYSEKKVPGAVNIPYDQLDEYASKLPAVDRTVLVYCKSGRRATILMTALKERGYGDVHVLQPSQILWHEDRGEIRANQATPE